MIQQKPATDEALVERARKAVANGDETMKPILEWDRRGRKPEKQPESKTKYDVPTKPISEADYRRAQKILRGDYETMTYKEIAKKYNLPYRRAWHIIKDNYDNPNPAAWKVLSTQDNAIT